MSEQERNAPDADVVSADSTQSQQDVADQQFMHGLLTSHHESSDTRGHRVQSVMSAIEQDADARPLRFPALRLTSGLAAAIVVVALVLTWSAPQQTALAMVEASLEAARRAGERRYVVYAERPDGLVDRLAEVDIRDDNHLLIRARRPGRRPGGRPGDRRGGPGAGRPVIVGRNADGPWSIQSRGEIEHAPPDDAWPRWISFGQNTLLIDSVDALLAELPADFDLSVHDAAPSPDDASIKCQRVVASRREPGESFEPQTIDLWIDPISRVVRRMELRWSERPDSTSRPTMDQGDHVPPGPHGRGPGPGLHRGPGGRGPGPFGRGPGGHGRGGRGFGPGGPRGRGGPCGSGGRGGACWNHGRPQVGAFGCCPHHDDNGQQPPPPIRMIFQLSPDVASFRDGWFDPETHVEPPRESPDSR